MNIHRLIYAVAAVAVLAGSCTGDDDGESASAPAAAIATDSSTTVPTTTVPTTTVPPTTESITTTVAPTTTTVAPTTTEAATTTSTSTSSTTTAAPTTSGAPDTDAPSAPTGLTCLSGGGSGELTIQFDAPADSTDVATVQTYVREPGGSFARINTFTVAELLDSEGPRWTTNLFPAPVATPIDVAVTFDDAAGNESGWNPIDAYYAYGAGPCEAGPPPAPSVDGALRGAGSTEVDLQLAGAATDVVDWIVTVDQGDGFAPVGVLTSSDLGGGAWSVTIAPLDWTLPATYRVVAVDAHGQSSAAGERDCPVPISPGDVAC
ncbi:MAG: hypothetical protein AAF548_18780 [Actinomycetota bacterium]